MIGNFGRTYGYATSTSNVTYPPNPYAFLDDDPQSSPNAYGMDDSTLADALRKGTVLSTKLGGSSRGDVRELQALLTQAGFSAKVDGRYGSSTASAVAAYQRSRGLAADGVAGPSTIGALLGGKSKVSGSVGGGSVGAGGGSAPPGFSSMPGFPPGVSPPGVGVKPDFLTIGMIGLGGVLLVAALISAVRA
jgi:hypothetical protein